MIPPHAGARWVAYTSPFHLASLYTNYLGARLLLRETLGILFALGLQFAVMTCGHALARHSGRLGKLALATLWLPPLFLSVMFSFAGIDHSYQEYAARRDEHLARKAHLQAEADQLSATLAHAKKNVLSHFALIQAKAEPSDQPRIARLTQEWNDAAVNLEPVSAALADAGRIDPRKETAAYQSLTQDHAHMVRRYGESISNKYKHDVRVQTALGDWKEPDLARAPRPFIAGAADAATGASDDFLGPLQRLVGRNLASCLFMAVASGIDIIPLLLALAMALSAGNAAHVAAAVAERAGPPETARLAAMTDSELMGLYWERLDRRREAGSGGDATLNALTQHSLENVLVAMEMRRRAERLAVLTDAQELLGEASRRLDPRLIEDEWQGIVAGANVGGAARLAVLRREIETLRAAADLSPEVESLRSRVGEERLRDLDQRIWTAASP